jgi:hypothetical protein
VGISDLDFRSVALGNGAGKIKMAKQKRRRPFGCGVFAFTAKPDQAASNTLAS